MPFGIQELATKTFVFTIQVLVPTNVFFIKLCFHQCGIQPNIAFIFWGVVKEITDSEKSPTKTMCSFSENNNWAYRRVFLEWENTHMRQISAYHNTKEDGYKEELRILKYNLDVKVQKQYQDMCQDRYNTLCWYYLLITHITCILLMKVQEIIPSFVLEFTFMSGFGTLGIWSYVS